MENKYADKQIINMNVYKLEKEAKKSIKLMHCGNYFVPLEKTLESPLDGKEIQPVRPTGNQPWIFTGRTDAEAKAPLLWPPDVNSPLTEKTLMLGKIEGKRRNGWQRMRWLDGITKSMDMSLTKFRELVMDREACHGVVEIGHDWMTEQQKCGNHLLVFTGGKSRMKTT